MEKRTGGGLGVTGVLWIVFIVLKACKLAFVNTSWVIIILWPIFLTLAVFGIFVGVVALVKIKLKNK